MYTRMRCDIHRQLVIVPVLNPQGDELRNLVVICASRQRLILISCASKQDITNGFDILPMKNRSEFHDLIAYQ